MNARITGPTTAAALALGSMIALLSTAATAQETPPGAPSAAQAPSPTTQTSQQDPRDRMDLAADLGVGFLEFFHLDVTYIHSREWSLGAGIGAFPIDRLLNRLAGTHDLSASASLMGYELSGSVDTRLLSGRIFGRWFPWKRFFFLEGTIEVWYMDMVAKASFEEESSGDRVTLKTTAKVWVPMIGIHIGWRILSKKGFYVDLGGGIDFLMSPGADVSFGGSAVFLASQVPQAAEAIDAAEKFFGDALEKGANRITKKIRVFPTGALRLGWAFDL